MKYCVGNWPTKPVAAPFMDLILAGYLF